MRKWQADTKVYSKRRNDLVVKATGCQQTEEGRAAVRDFIRVVKNFDGMLGSVSEMNWRYRYQERTPQGYRKAVTRLDEYLNEVEQLATILLLTYSEE